MSRLAPTFAALRAQNKAALVSFIVAGDPNPALSQEILDGLPAAGVDIIELGMPFTDPMADGPTIQAADIRALSAGMTLQKTLDMVAVFRSKNTVTPIVLMGYYNPVYIYGPEKFAAAAAKAGVDGMILVDLPPEEDEEIRPFLRQNNIDLIRLITPTTSPARIKTIAETASGFLYYVSITGVTGTAAIDVPAVAGKIAAIRSVTDLPIAVGFGIRTPMDAAAVSKVADGVVIGSAFVQTIEKTIENQTVNEVYGVARTYKAAFA
jgi:tryptophan synthase alpha chain